MKVDNFLKYFSESSWWLQTKGAFRWHLHCLFQRKFRRNKDKKYFQVKKMFSSVQKRCHKNNWEICQKQFGGKSELFKVNQI
jgi:hypothetical protein